MAIDVLTEEVATNLEEVAEVTRRIDTRSIGFFVGGIVVGAAVGFYFGHRWNREKIKAEEFARSEKEIARFREVYQQKTIAAKSKPPIDEVLKDAGYSNVEVAEKMNVSESVVLDRLKPPVPISPGTASPLYRGWDYPRELSQRTVDRPYVIHFDEFTRGESGYSQVTYTYYAEDGVVTDEDDQKLLDVNGIVGLDNLVRFGHGSGDDNVVFIRNSKLELEAEICRDPGSYEENVLGLEREPDETD